MPQFLETILRGEAKQRGFRGKKAKAYVYGTLNNIGAMHGNQITPKGQAMEAKHTEKIAAQAAKRSTPKMTVKQAKQPHPQKFPDVHGYSWKTGRK